jgi:hypothetical protein
MSTLLGPQEKKKKKNLNPKPYHLRLTFINFKNASPGEKEKEKNLNPKPSYPLCFTTINFKKACPGKQKKKKKKFFSLEKKP